MYPTDKSPINSDTTNPHVSIRLRCLFHVSGNNLVDRVPTYFLLSFFSRRLGPAKIKMKVLTTQESFKRNVEIELNK